MRKVLFGLACWATIGLASSRADVTYRYVTDQTNYTGAVGSTVPVQLLLQETVTTGSTSKIFTDNGLFGAGVMVNSPGGTLFGNGGDFKISPNGAASPTGFGGLTNVPAPGTPTNPTFADQTPAGPTKSGLIINADVPGTGNPAGSASGPKFADGTPGIRSILLGTINVTVGATPQTLTVTPYGGSFNTITQAGTDLDFGTQAANGYTGASQNPLGNFSFTVGAAIPEPSSIALCGLLTFGMGYVGYRRRKTSVSAPAILA